MNSTTHMPFIARIDGPSADQLPGVKALIPTDTQVMQVDGLFPRSRGFMTNMAQERSITGWLAHGGHAETSPPKPYPWGIARAKVVVDNDGVIHYVHVQAISPLHRIDTATTYHDGTLSPKPSHATICTIQRHPSGNGRKDMVTTMTFTRDLGGPDRFVLAEMTRGAQSAHRTPLFHYELGKMVAAELDDSGIWWWDPCTVTANRQRLLSDTASLLRFGAVWIAGSSFIGHEGDHCDTPNDLRRAGSYASRRTGALYAWQTRTDHARRSVSRFPIQ